MFLIKTAPKGKPEVGLITLEEPIEGDANGLRDGLNTPISSLNPNEEFDRKTRGIGMCSDGARVNFSFYKLLKTDIGEHYLHVLCPAHLLELGVQIYFEISSMNAELKQFCINIHYLFKRTMLRWHLFKRQANFVGINQKRYKRPSGTKWVVHQVDNLASHNHNLPILLRFFNQQIIAPHNESIRKVKDTFISHKNDATNLDYVIFNEAKEDILGILRPLSKSFLENALVLPSLLTNILRTFRTMTKFQKLLNDEGQEACFSVTCQIIEQNITSH